MKATTTVTTSEHATVWTYGYPDEPDDQVGQLGEGEPVILLGERYRWEDDVSLKPGGNYIYRCLTRIGVGWINDDALML